MLQPGKELRNDPWGPSQLLKWASVNTDVCWHLGPSKLLRKLWKGAGQFLGKKKKGQRIDAVREDSVCEIKSMIAESM